ncbi:MAG: CPBP family intramembrane glutamic endopeptidase [Elusimicrobiota bacterium]
MLLRPRAALATVLALHCALSPVDVLAQQVLAGAASRAGTGTASAAAASVGASAAGRGALFALEMAPSSLFPSVTTTPGAVRPAATLAAVAVPASTLEDAGLEGTSRAPDAQTPDPITAVVVAPETLAESAGAVAQDKEWAGSFFDRSKPHSTRAERLLSRGEQTIAFMPPVLQAPITGAVSSRLGKRFLPTALVARWGKVPAASAPKPAFDEDGYGGPNHAPLNLRGRIGLGVRYGVMITGAAFVIEYAVGLLTSLPLEWLGSGALESVGRVELLISMGPRLLAETLKDHPFWFLAVSLPAKIFKEELTYRGVQFLGYFAFVMAARWGLTRFSALANAVPDIGYVRSTLQWLAAKLTMTPYVVAAWLVALNFAGAHTLHWGDNPAVFFTQFIASLILTRAAYRTHSLIAPFTAHLVFSLLTMAAIMLALHAAPGAAAAYQLALGVGSVSYLAYRLARRAVLKRLAQTVPPIPPVEPA